MTGDEYIEGLLSKYAVATGPLSPAEQAANGVAPRIRTWAGAQLQDLMFSGSYAKGTGVKGSADVDLFISLKADTGGTLKEIFESLYAMADSAAWRPRSQNVSVRLTYGGVNVDLTPGKIQEGYRDYHSIYKSKTGTWTQTNIKLHIQTVRSSGRINEIRALKIWRNSWSLDFPSFYLELVMLEALRYARSGLASNVLAALAYLRDHLESLRVVDPANTANIVSDDLTTSEKRHIAAMAGKAHSAPTWSETLW